MFDLEAFALRLTANILLAHDAETRADRASSLG
jgi:hypothetical protein